MSSTKIINVLKDDSFSEILDLFKATPAEEVIFVLPKRSKAFQKEDHFVQLRSEAKSAGKVVSFLCSSPELNELAKKHRFDVLLARSPIPRKTAKPGKVNSIDVVNQIEDFYSEPADPSESISIQPAAAQEESDEEDLDDESAEEYVPAVAASMRRLDDVFVPESDNQHSVKVSGKNEKAQPVDVHQDDFAYEPLESEGEEEIKSMWSTQTAPQMRTAVAQRSWSNWFRSSAPKSSLKKPNAGQPAHRTGLVVLACTAVVVLGTVVFITTGKAQVTIKPVSDPLDARLTVIASDNIPAVNPIAMAVPGQVFNIQKSVSQDFPATGHVNVAQKARGSITVYNELSASQPLVATTRFESADHHIFHTMTSVVVPAAKTVNGKLTPGIIEVQIIADKPGSDYNVPAGVFTIPAFKEKGDTTKYQKTYGKAEAAIHSGTSGQASVVTDSDLTAGKQALSVQLTKNIQDELKSQIAGLKVINDSSVVIGQPTSTNPADSATSTFTLNLSGSLKTVGFKESDLQSLIARYVDTRNNATVIPDKLTLAYEDVHWDDARNGLVFTVHVTGPAYEKVDQEKIINDLMGKGDNEIKAYLGGISAISSAHVSLSPFWVRSVPKSQDRIKVDISY
jgi:hypothetical protein